MFFEIPIGFEINTCLRDDFIFDDGCIFANLNGFGTGKIKYKLSSKRKLNILLLAEFNSDNQFLYSTVHKYWNEKMKNIQNVEDKLDITKFPEKNNELISHLKNRYENIDGYFSSLEDNTVEEFCFFNKNDFYVDKYYDHMKPIHIKSYEKILNSIKIKINISEYTYVQNIYMEDKICEILEKILDDKNITKECINSYIEDVLFECIG